MKAPVVGEEEIDAGGRGDGKVQRIQRLDSMVCAELGQKDRSLSALRRVQGEIKT
jgi:hypothetical protein